MMAIDQKSVDMRYLYHKKADGSKMNSAYQNQNIVMGINAAKRLGVDMKYFDAKTFVYCNRTLILSFFYKLNSKYPLNFISRA